MGGGSISKYAEDTLGTIAWVARRAKEGKKERKKKAKSTGGARNF